MAMAVQSQRSRVLAPASRRRKHPSASPPKMAAVRSGMAVSLRMRAGRCSLVPGGVGQVQDALVKDLGGLGPHAAKNAKALFGWHRQTPFLFGLRICLFHGACIPLRVPPLVPEDAQPVNQIFVGGVEGVDPVARPG